MELRDKNGLTEAEFLAAYSPGDFPRPSVTADILVFAQQHKQLELLMIKRGGHPCLGMWALPGGFSNPDESLDKTALRELEEETHIKGLLLKQIGLFSAPNRDPRTWVITCAYMGIIEKENLMVQADDDASDSEWFTVSTEQHDGQMDLKLTSPKAILSARLEIQEIQTRMGIHREINMISSDGIAFDHAKIIATALFHL